MLFGDNFLFLNIWVILLLISQHCLSQKNLWCWIYLQICFNCISYFCILMFLCIYLHVIIFLHMFIHFLTQHPCYVILFWWLTGFSLLRSKDSLRRLSNVHYKILPYRFLAFGGSTIRYRHFSLMVCCNEWFILFSQYLSLSFISGGFPSLEAIVASFWYILQDLFVM